jgi:hypothetical protein
MHLITRVSLLKLFWRIFSQTYLKARPFYNISNIYCIVTKRCSLQKVNLSQKSFVRSTPNHSNEALSPCKYGCQKKYVANFIK